MNSPSSTLSLSLVRGWIALGDMLKLLPAYHGLQAVDLLGGGTLATILGFELVQAIHDTQ